jgi:hypothetical protein
MALDISFHQIRPHYLLAIVFCLAFAGCSGMHDMPDEPKPSPDVQKAVPNIKTVAGQYHLTGPLEIAGPIEAPIVSTPPWIICLKSASQPRFTVALFYKGDSYVSARTATIGDRCDSQTYRPLPN